MAAAFAVVVVVAVVRGGGGGRGGGGSPTHHPPTVMRRSIPCTSSRSSVTSCVRFSTFAASPLMNERVGGWEYPGGGVERHRCYGRTSCADGRTSCAALCRS